MKRRPYDVAFYAPWAGPNLTPGQAPSGGAEVQILHLARGLAGRGRYVEVMAYDVPGLPTRKDGVDVVAQHDPPARLGPLGRAAVPVGTVLSLLRLRANTIVQRSAGGTTFLVALAARLSGTRFVYSSANTSDFDPDAHIYTGRTKKLFALGIRLADAVVVQTDEQAELCRKRFGRDPVVIRSVAERAEPVADGRDSDGFLWVGRVVDYKRPEAFLDLAQALPDAPFTMVCVPGHDEALQRAVRERATALPNVELLGPQSRPDLMARIASATAIVSTSDFEGMPNTLIEGWSRGVPAITLSHDPDDVIARHGLGHTAGGDIVRFTADARALWDGRADDAELRARCVAYVRGEHDPEVVLDRWERVLEMPPGFLVDKDNAPAPTDDASVPTGDIPAA